MKIKIWYFFYYLFVGVTSLPVDLLYEPEDSGVVRFLDRENDISSDEIDLRVPVVLYGVTYSSVFINSNGFLSFQTDIPHFINIEFPLDYPIISPFYSNVDIRRSGQIYYYETQDPELLHRATENVHECFLDAVDFQARSLFIATWKDVGYFNQGADKLNTFQVVIITNGQQSYLELLYPENGIQWIQGTGDESGLPDARAQVGILSADGKMFTLPGSGTEQVRNLEKWTNMGLQGQFLFRIDGPQVLEPDFNNQGSVSSSKNPQTCSEAPTACHSQARCNDYEGGFCCQCNQRFFGNGKYCVKEDLPLRVTGKVNGKLNGERLENLDLQSYIVTNDGRAYTAVSKIPESIGSDVQTLQILGGVIGYLFAKPVRGAQNGFQLTGGLLNQSSTITFLNTSQVAHVNQKFLGLDVFDQLRVDIDVHGEIPTLPGESRVTIDEYQEQYTQTGYDLIQMTSERSYIYNTISGEEVTSVFKVEQTFRFDYCPFKNNSIGETWNLKVGRNFISYESREQIIRFGLSNKVTPIGDFDPCEEGRRKCGPNSACVVDGNNYDCACNPGYQRFYSGSDPVCGDVNECQTGLHECDYNAQCTNTIGSYNCICNPGFEGNGRVCENARSCSNVSCTENAECIEYGDGASCKCIPGFRGDGVVCKPIVDQTCDVNNNCSPYGLCSFDPQNNQYSCSCLPGYQGDGYTCEPIPQTTTTTEETTTVSESSSYKKETQRCLLGVCWCPEGYAIETGTMFCLPLSPSPPPAPERVLDELETPEVQCYNDSICFCPKGFKFSKIIPACLALPLKENKMPTKGASNIKYSCTVVNNCDPNAQCLYSENLQNYVCTCNDGFHGDGFNCQEEQVSCTKVDNCNVHATCTYDENIGKSKCVCNPGYDGDGFSCSVVAECSSSRDCTSTEECLYNNNRYECVCKEGHVRDSQHICVPTSGSCGGGTCVENAECLFDDDYQTFYCTCKPGYVGDGITECKLKPIGCDTLNNCGFHATCHYEEQALTYVCHCNPGFFGDGFNCNVERNCNVDPSVCDFHAACYADAERRYVCQCRPGYVGNGTICKEISRTEGNFLLLNQGMATLKIPMEPNKKNPGKPIQIRPYQTAVGLDIDCMEGRVYWSDISGRAIRSSLYNGSNKVDFIVNAIGSPEGLAVDWVSRNIYWTDSTSDTIEVANLDSKRRRKLFGTGLVNPRGIAVHPQRGKIFWTDWDRTHPKIEWANADGTNREIFLEGGSVSLPNSLAIDYDTEQLCFSDAGSKKIECVQIDTRQIQTIAINCTYPFGIAITDKLVYWSDWISKKIERVDKYTLNRLPPLAVPLGGSGNKLFGLVAVPNSCPSLTNVCQYNKNQCPAEHICLPNGYGSRSCLCSYRSDDPSDEPSCVL